TAVAGDYAIRAPAGNMQAQWAFRNAMNKLWEDHIAWTRSFIVAVASDSPSVPAVTNRLLQNQVDIGNAIKPYHGTAAGDQVTVLLKEHITVAAEVVGAAKAGDTAKKDEAAARWFANADAIAAFLSKANSQAWPQAHMSQMMDEHLNLTMQEAAAELTGDWNGSIAAYDKVHQQILKMSAGLADGIIGQFPDKF
ncbi:MAG: hypothetical protein M3R04_10925, partial [bacterium]|nr:hypothetical protein [bacterium]